MGVTKETYPATVTANNDDENRGRIKVACAQLLGDEDTELPMWVDPLLDWGWFYVPDVGETVDVEVVTDSDEDEVRGQMALDNLDIKWKGKRYYTEDVTQNPNTTATPVHPDFESPQYKRRGFATPHGHILMFDDDPAAPAIQLTWMKTPIVVGTPPLPMVYTRVEIEPDGSLKASLLDAHKIHLETNPTAPKLTVSLDSDKHLIVLDGSPLSPKLTASLDSDKHSMVLDADPSAPKAELKLANGDHMVTLDGSAPSMSMSLAGGDHSMVLDGAAPKMEVNLAGGDHNIKVDGSRFTANTGGGAGIDVSGKDGDASATIGDGAVEVAIAPHLKTYIDTKVKVEIDAHIHPTAMGPSGTMPTPLTGYDDAITSTKVKIPDN